MKIVIDTNVVISGFLWGGLPKQVLSVLDEGDIRNAISPFMLGELRRVLSREKFKKFLQKADLTIDGIVEAMTELSETVEPETIPEVCRDVKDNHILACALTAQAICIVSGDSDLLDLESHEGIQLMTAAEFLELIADQSGNE